MQVATIVDKVDLRKDQYHINSTGSLGAVLSTALNDQKLIRDSSGTINKDGMLTNTYQEKRGNTELLIAKVEKSAVNFYKVSSRTPPYRDSDFFGAIIRYGDSGLSVYRAGFTDKIYRIASDRWPFCKKLHIGAW